MYELLSGDTVDDADDEDDEDDNCDDEGNLVDFALELRSEAVDLVVVL